MKTNLTASMCIAVYFGLGGCQRATPPTSSVSAPATTANRQPNRNEIYDLRRKCALDAREWFKQNYPESEPIPVQGGGSIISQPTGYENHYSESQNRCYALLHSIYSTNGPKGRNSMFIQSNLLWDVNENVQLGAFVVKDLTGITACNVTESQCKTKEEWLSLARPYLTD
jgi:hypothetical protein